MVVWTAGALAGQVALPTTGTMPLQIQPDGPAVIMSPRSTPIESMAATTATITPPALPVPPAGSTALTAESLAAKKARFWRVLYQRTRGPLFLLILSIVFIVVLVLSIRGRRPVRLGRVSARSFVLSVLIHLMLLVGFNSWVISHRIIQTLHDPEFEILIDSDNLAEEKVSLGIREETTKLPSADSTIAMAPQRAELPLPEVIPTEDTPPVVPGQVEVEAYELPEEIAQPAPRKRNQPAAALAARVSVEFKIAPPQPVFELPKPARSPKPAEMDSVRPEMTVEKVEEPLEFRITPRPSRIDLPAVEFEASLQSGLVDTPSLPPARPKPPEREAAARLEAARLVISAPNVKFRIPKLQPPVEPPKARKPQPKTPPLQPETEPPERPRLAEPTSLEPGAPLVASLTALPALTGVPNSTRREPTVPRRVLMPSPSPRPVPPPFTLEEKPFMSEPYRLRKPEERVKVLDKMGGTTKTEEAVQDALKWLAAHQSKDGRWDIDGFDKDCGQCGGAGKSAGSDVAATALATLAFLGAGNTHLNQGPYRDTVARAVGWLVAQEKGRGNLSGRGTMYDQGMATIALAEAYGMTHDASLRPVIERAVAYIAAAQHPKTGGWRYFPGDPGDTSVFGWQVMALKSASMAGVPVPKKTLDMALRWLKKVGGGKYGGLCGYQSNHPTRAMVAEGMFCHQLFGKRPSDPMMVESAEYLGKRLPGSSETNFYYWYYGTLACFQQGGDVWENWNRAMRKALLTTQQKSGRRAGSWNPVGKWGDSGGRVVQTAFATLCLEVYYRYLPMYKPLAKDLLAKSDSPSK